MRELVHENSVSHLAPPNRPHGLEAEWKAVEGLRAAFPDIHFTIEESLAEGDRVAVRVTGRGTHQGEFMGIPATGNQVEFPLFDLARIEDGKMVEHSELFGMFALLSHLGAQVVPPPS